MIDQRLRTFLTIAQLGSYTQAAKALYISQPAVSQQIKSLENELQVKLFHYQKRHLSLTPAGQRLLLFADDLSAQANKIRQELVHPNAAPTLNFAATLSISEALVPKIMASFYRQHPKAQITCTTLNTQGCLDKLRAGEVEFALIEGNFDSKPYATAIIGHDPFIGVASPQLGLPTTPLQLTALLKLPLVYREAGSGSYAILNHLLDTQNLTPADFQAQIQVSSPDTIKRILAEGVGISFLYQSVVQEQLANGTLQALQLANVQITHPIYYAALPNHLLKAEQLHFLRQTFQNEL
ncbi:LysR family transcriptional regulator [Lactobacillus selangorensis]|nr:LysR family transcriptional regulator [Lactobacillus selangorensis]